MPKGRQRAPDLSVVVPAFNEERRLLPTLQRLQAYLRQRKAEVLVVDDGSTDGTPALVQGLARRWKALRLVSLAANAGKRARRCAKAGQARGRAHPLHRCGPVDAHRRAALPGGGLKNGFSVAIGSRALDRARVGVRQPFYREAGGRAFNKLVQALTVAGIEDTQCGFKLFEAQAAKRLFARQQVPRFGFDVEVLYLARTAGSGRRSPSCLCVGRTRPRPAYGP